MLTSLISLHISLYLDSNDCKQIICLILHVLDSLEIMSFYALIWRRFQIPFGVQCHGAAISTAHTTCLCLLVRRRLLGLQALLRQALENADVFCVHPGLRSQAMLHLNVSQFAQPRKHHGQQCGRNNVSSFTRAFMLRRNATATRTSLIGEDWF